jgi:predicted metal-dependent peptidase
VLFEYLRDKRIEPQAIIQFTDGYVGDFGNSNIPTLWVITDKSIKAPWGQTLHINI